MVPRGPELEPADPELLSAARTRVVPTEVQERDTSPRAASEADTGESFVVPPRISRFTLLRQIGEGGMGVVFAAYDDELDRKVAIKLLRPSSGDSLGTARLQREAQAMARLAHPNIVRVYEVGAIVGRVYLVMEMVHGDTLRAWLKAGPRGWREVLAVLVQAGRGLAAAHTAGLVHRDFKPDNRPQVHQRKTQPRVVPADALLVARQRAHKRRLRPLGVPLLQFHHPHIVQRIRDRQARIALQRRQQRRQRRPAILGPLRQMLWAVGEERARAVALAGEARDGYAAVGERMAAEQAAVAAWLAAHRSR